MKLCPGELTQIRQSENTDISDELRGNNNVKETTTQKNQMWKECTGIHEKRGQDSRVLDEILTGTDRKHVRSVANLLGEMIRENLWNKYIIRRSFMYFLNWMAGQDRRV